MDRIQVYNIVSILTFNYAETMRLLIPFLLLFSTIPVSAVEVYKSVDENGNTVFSDQPSDNAEKIEVKDIPTVPGFTDYPVDTHREPAVVERYSEIAIINPKNDQTYWRGEGDLVVSVAMKPRLSAMDKVVLYLDGEEILADTGTTFVLSELDRGTHQLRVSIRDRDGTIIKSSETVSFHVKQTSILNPRFKAAPAPMGTAN